ncbi:MAG: transglycosylase domain-containing protein [Chitinophagaceae bacterium]|nr:transglycosylase domain-containing protein [Oligoflexus sp.]
MQQKFQKIIAATGAFALLSTLAFNLVLAPMLLAKAQVKLRDWFRHTSVAVEFKEVKLLWNGIRIVNLEVHRGEDEFRSDVSVHFGLTTTSPFVKPKLVTFERAHILMVRNASKTETDDNARTLTGNEAKPSVNELLDRYFTAGVSVFLDRADIQIFDSKRELLVAIPSLSLKLNARDRTAQIATENLQFKQSTLLSQMSGQILMQKQRESYPFLLQARDPNGDPWQLKGQISHDFDRLDVRHKRIGVPSAWTQNLAVLGNPNDVQLLVRLKVDGIMSRDKIEYDIKIASNNLYLQHQSLGKNSLGPWPFSFHSRGVFVPESGSLAVDQGALSLIGRTKTEPLFLSFSGFKKNLQSPIAVDPFEIKFHLQNGSCQSVLDSVPQNLLPALSGLELDGHFAIDGTLRLLSRQDIVNFTPKLNHFNCKIIASPAYLTRNWLFGGPSPLPEFLQHNPSMLAIKSGRAISRRLIPDDFFKGLVAAEDAKFWRHDGILIPSLIAALEANLKAGHVVFGGSTITMQLAKNLYLDRDRVISRKIQEIALAWVLEQNLTKAEILELYANAVEFAPQTYGIGKAASLYFNKPTQEMTIAESLFLASILPSPTRNFADSYCQARLSPEIKKRMQNVAEGLSTLSREADFMKTYETDMHAFQFPDRPRGCESLDRISQSKTRSPRL